MKYTVILVLVIMFIFIICITKNKKEEGFESYHNCLNQGYPQNFCLNVPAQSMINPDNSKACGLDFYKV